MGPLEIDTYVQPLSLPEALPILVPRGLVRTGKRAWAASGLHIARAVLGIRCELRGLENLPPGAAILASKHQSAFDTLVFNVILPDVAYVLKREQIGRAHV